MLGIYTYNWNTKSIIKVIEFSTQFSSLELDTAQPQLVVIIAAIISPLSNLQNQSLLN
jgi:ethanolamine utilization protein EutQ (cupin superfamily)